MATLQLISHPEVAMVFANYPATVRSQMLALRALVIATAEEIEGLTLLEETLKWGEPSFVTKHGSTLRMDWKAKSPDQYALYFKCTSKLVATFQLVFGATFQYEGKRALVFSLPQSLPIPEVKACIKAALTYHKVKHLPNLGM